MTCLDKITLKLRHELAWKAMNTLAPKLSQELDYAWHRIYVETPRTFTLMLKKTFDYPLTGAEIGYGLGYNAESILKELPIKELYCVDPFFGEQAYNDSGIYVDWYRNKVNDEEFKQRKRNLWRTGKVRFIHEFSETAFHNLPENLDFIYIDGNHSYRNVMQDLIYSMNHVKVGGYVGGHDYFNPAFEVNRAVYDYEKNFHIKPTFEFPDFWFKVTSK